MNSDKNKKGISDADNELAGRALMVGVFAVIGLLVLAVSPILVGGFLIGLIWYGAFMEDGEPNGERIVWPVILTLATFVYFLGLVPPFDQYFRGVMFVDFNKWTMEHLSKMIDLVNEILPRKFMIHSVSFAQVRVYCWTLVPAAVASFVYLHFNGAGRGVFLYRGIHAMLTPFRALAARWQWLAVASVSALILIWATGSRAWIQIGVGGTLVFLWIYHWVSGQSEKVGNSPSNSDRVAAGPIILGHEKGKPNKRLMLTEEQLNHHVHVVGASGFGKSVLLSHVIKNRIQSGSGLLFVDLKADFETIRQVVSVAKGVGRIDDLLIFSCGNPQISSPYNVVASGTANQLKDRIMGALNWSEEFYKNEASSFLLKLLRGLVVVRDSKAKPFDLSDILKCAEDPRNISAIINDLPEREREIRGQLGHLIGHLGKPENQRALQGLRSQLESLIYSDFGPLLKANSSGIDLFEAIRGRKIVYVLLDSRTYGESSRALGKLILQDLKAASARVDSEIPREQRTPFTVVVDEFADMATEDFIGFLDRARSSKMGVVVAHQEIADLSRISPEFSRRLMNATSTLYAFLQKLPDSSELISGISGTRKTKEVTEQAKSNWLFGDEKTGMKSIKEVDEYVIHPNVIRSLPVGECVLVQKYPTSKSAVIKVRPESRDYHSEEEVKSTLGEMTARHLVEQRPTGPSIAPPPLQRRLRPESKSYWNEDAEKKTIEEN